MLSAGQAALLAGMARSPARYDPYRHPEVAAARARYVLGRMRQLGLLGDEEARVAAETPLDLVPPERAFRAPHLTTWLERSLDELGLDAAVKIETTLDPGLQAGVEQAIAEELSGLAQKQVGQAAVIVVDNASGEVLAWAGSASFFDEARGGQNDGVRALRQPGSALKPFAYGLALASGFTPATLLSDLETHLSTPSGSYAPHNYDRRLHGPVRLRAALANSYNIPAVRLAEQLGPDRILELLRRAGFESLTRDAGHYGVGLVLGNGDVTLRELARAYRGLARGGLLEPLTELKGARDARGEPIRLRPELAPRRFLPPAAAALLTDILADEAARAPAFGRDNALRLPFPVAAKTGTSRAHVDNWTAGYTRERTVAVWVGNFDGTPMRGVSGITGAGPLFKRVMLLAMRGLTPAPLVDRAQFDPARICALSGALAGPHCPGALEERFLPGSAPTAPCPMHRQGSRLDVGPEYYAWARAEGLEAGPAHCDATGGGAPGARLLMPADGDEYLLEPDLPAEAQSIPVRALPPAGVERLELRLDDGTRLVLGPPFAGRIPAVAGAHRLELHVPGASGPAAVARYRVR
jgi:penicillin-binding protein 1C